MDKDEQLELYNSRGFRGANQLVYAAELLLMAEGMSQEKARDWIQVWASGAGDGAH